MTDPGAGVVQRGARRPACESGAQALEFALALPFVVLVLALVLHAAWLGSDLIAVQGLAREAARTAAVASDDVVRERVRHVVGARGRVSLVPASGARRPGQPVTAHVRLRTGAFAAFGVTVWLPAQATMLVEAT